MHNHSGEDIGLFIGALVSFWGFIKATSLFKDVRAMQVDLRNHKDNVQNNYPTKKDMHEALSLTVTPLSKKMDEIHEDVKEINKREIARLEKEADK